MKLAKPLVLFALLTASAIAQTAHDAVLKNLKFRNIGPATMGGRVDDLAVVESDPRIIYVGSAAGGIFKTVNGGNTWQAHLRRSAEPLYRRPRARAIQFVDPLRGHRRGQQPPKLFVG